MAPSASQKASVRPKPGRTKGVEGDVELAPVEDGVAEDAAIHADDVEGDEDVETSKIARDPRLRRSQTQRRNDQMPDRAMLPHKIHHLAGSPMQRD